MLQIKQETADISQYKVGNNANIANFVQLWKPRLTILLCFKIPLSFVAQWKRVAFRLGMFIQWRLQSQVIVWS